MKIAIIDDERDARLTLRNFMSRYADIDYKLAEADSIKTGIELINTFDPELVFLDIHFPGGTGFDVLDAIPRGKFKTVFTTAHDKHAIKAFKYSAVDYLLKPIDPDDFKAALVKTRALKLEELQSRLDHLETLAARAVFNKMAFPSAQGTIYIDLSEIVHLNSDGNYTTIQTVNDRKITVTRILKEFEELLPSSHFFRTHKSHIVNIQHVNEFRKSDESLIMTNGNEIPVARRRKEDLMNLLC